MQGDSELVSRKEYREHWSQKDLTLHIFLRGIERNLLGNSVTFDCIDLTAHPPPPPAPSSLLAPMVPAPKTLFLKENCFVVVVLSAFDGGGLW